MANEEKLLDHLKWVTSELRRARQRLAVGQEPIAIVGMACRYPGGANTPESFWELLESGTDAISDFPTDRGWELERLYDPDPDKPGTTYAKQGGFLHEAADFDPTVFGISPREALAMDPQQRLVLETSWEALERAGVNPQSLNGSRTGVFIGALATEYASRLGNVPEGVEGYLGTGTQTSVLSGRVSYTLGLQGPAATVDTACSSSLVAIHLGMQALRRDECSMALVGGVTVMSTPDLFTGLSRQRAVSPDGRCKAFGAAADGFGPSEGAGMLLVERLSDAQRNGHRVLGVLRGSATNQDGASNGLTAPNDIAQARLIEQARADSRLGAEDLVDVIEAHGTGTALGDPIEAQALLATYGKDRDPEQPLYLGSAKSNIGHTSAAAGVAGVLKMVLAMEHGVLPRTLHAEEPSPHIDWSDGVLKLLDEARPWPREGRPRRAAVSSFGISGTNAHVILEDAPDPSEGGDPSEGADAAEGAEVADRPDSAEKAAEADAQPAAPRAETPLGGPTALVLSGVTPEALRGQAARLREFVDSADGTITPADLGHSLAATRATFESRGVVLAGDHEEAVRGLDALASGSSTAQTVRGTAAASDQPVFVFPGQGSQWAGMAVELLDSSTVFADRLEQCAEALRPHVDWSLLDVLRESEGAPTLERVDVVQPVLFAMMVSLAEVWRSHGVEPAAVIGHSQGEIAAACVAGALSLEDAAKVVALRAKALLAVAGEGGMVSVAEPAKTVAQRITGWGKKLAVAANNGPLSTVVSGTPEALDELMAACEAEDVRAKRIAVDYASHSPQMEKLKKEVTKALAGIEPVTARVPFFSTVTGEFADGAELDALYWHTNLRHTVRFEESVRALIDAGHEAFVEVSPHPVLTVGITECAADADAAAFAVGSLRRDEGDEARFRASLAEAWVHGVRVDWGALAAAQGGRTVPLPTYAFQRERFWLEQDHSTPRPTDGDPVDQWRYRVAWRPLAEPGRSHLDGTWLLIVPLEHQGHPFASQVVEALEQSGAETRTVVVGGLEGADRNWLAERLSVELAETGPVAGVLSLAALDERPATGRGTLPGGLILHTVLLQALDDAALHAPLWSLTSGAVSVDYTDQLRNPLQAMNWGLGRISAQEHSRRWGGLVDLPTEFDERAGRRLVAALAGLAGEDQLAIRPVGIFVRRIQRAADEPRLAGGGGWRPKRRRGRSTVLVTGGTGGIGAHVARWLARSGVSDLLLASRRGPDATGVDELVAELGELGAEVTVVACDVADPRAVRRMLDELPDERQLTAVFHLAGELDDGLIDHLTPNRAARVLRAKADSALVLHEATKELDLSAFVLFSSMAGTMGAPGQGSYAAANAYLDALTRVRRAEGLPATSIAWGEWDTDGMVDERAAESLRSQGVLPMDPERAIEVLERALDQDEIFLLVSNMDWSVLPGSSEPALRDLPEAQTETRVPTETVDTGQQHSVLLGLVRNKVALVLGHDPERVDAVPPERAFRDMGFDSLTSVELRNRLAEATGLRLPATLIYDHPTAVRLASFLQRSLYGSETEVEEAEAASRSAVTASTAATEDPIAIVGMACRYPGGVSSPEDLWKLVAAGGDAVTPFPTNRGWDLEGTYDPDPDRPGRHHVQGGGFLHEADQFDADFFGISPREAVASDPQQRLILETSWEVFEHAGIDPTSLRGSQTGVFIGAVSSDYLDQFHPVPEDAESHGSTGNMTSVLSGRVAYSLGLAGPAVTLDTACSSSLVAIHLAAQALRNGECRMAVAGGVTVMSTQLGFIEMSRQRAISVDGRSKAFSASADGYGMGEGTGVVLLQPLSEARREGREVLAVLRGTATNQDGASNGLSAPNVHAQRRVIQQALANARVDAAQVDVVEAHGTGTELGDPIEAQALFATYGQRPSSRPLMLASLKSNIGHTAGAAGVAGVIKMVKAFEHGSLPRTLHVDEPSPHIDWSSGTVKLLTEEQDWPAGRKPRRAGVSSFGISGTNAHAILEEPPRDANRAKRDVVLAAPAGGAAFATTGGILPWPLSGRTVPALRQQAKRLAAHVAMASELRPVDVGWSLTGRSAFERRGVVLGSEREDFLNGLRSLDEGEPGTHVLEGVVLEGAAKPVFVFPGQGSQWVRMGVELLESSPVFAGRLAECETALNAHVDWSLTDVLRGAEDAPGLERVDVVQPVLWAVMVSLAELWRSCGVRPAAVIGHSQGEIAAACVAGALSLEDAAQVVALRARALTNLAGKGGMVSVPLGVDEVRELLAERADGISVASVNGPGSTVVAGAADALEDLLERCEQRDVRAKRIAVDYASHSEYVEEIREEVLAALSGVEPGAARVPFLSTVTGGFLGGTELNAEYWYSNLRQTVRFADGVNALLAAGHGAFVEVSAHPVLTMGVSECVADGSAVVLGSLRRDEGGPERFLASLAEAWVRGVPVEWSAVFAGREVRRVDLPTYAFQHRRYWLEAEPPVSTDRVGTHSGTADPVEERFWEAVEREDLESLAATLGLDEQETGNRLVPLSALSSWRKRRQHATMLDGWRYQVQWRRQSGLGGRAPDGDWILAVPAERADDDLVRDVCQALRERVGGAVTLTVSDDDGRRTLAERLTTEAAEHGPLAGVLSLLAFDERPHETYPQVSRGLVHSLEIGQALVDSKVDTKLWLVTSEAVVAYGATDKLRHPGQSAVWGLGRTFGLEHAQLWGGLVDVPATLDGNAAGWLREVLGSTGDEDQVAVRSAGVYTRRLVRAPRVEAEQQGWGTSGTALVTGGLGGLGRYAARMLVGSGAEHLVLTGRRGQDTPGADDVRAELEGLGVGVTIAACDVTDQEQLAEVVRSVEGEHGPIRSVVHTAATVVEEAPFFAETSLADFASEAAAKVLGAVHLDALFDREDLDAFVLYSSAAGAYGTGRQASYGAANTHLDALAENRRARGLPATSLAWGAWGAKDPSGGLMSLDGLSDYMARRGVLEMAPEQAIAGLRQALEDDETYLVVTAMDWDRFLPTFTATRPRPLLNELPEVRKTLASQAADDAQDEGESESVTRLRAELADLATEERESALLDVVRRQVARVLGHGDPEEVETERAFRELGVDSVTALELRNQLDKATGLKLKPTVVFDSKSPVVLAGHLAGKMGEALDG